MKNVGGAAQRAAEEHTTGERGTRDRVARSILDHGPSTAADLAERLGLTQTAVRRHLDILVAEHVVEPRERRVYGNRGRGRPAKVFVLTDFGRDAFDQAYDQLAADALHWIAQSAGGGADGQAAVSAFARARVAAQAERYRAIVAAAAPEDRTRALAQALSADGYAATTRSVPGPAGEQLCQHHCPVAHTAEQFPQLCEAEAEVFSTILGTHVQRLATIAHGDGVCTTFVPRSAARAAPEAAEPPGASAPPDDVPPAPDAPTHASATSGTPGRNPA
ncbi:helix-turn-helix transcriptional regulator [Actinacidiphila acididurans]|uniref:Winged helix-turn-helix transcriptional regulator n=1 Tax=Actinacidiphila acididurans TaxID=2784346 RepID=A0ABS2TQK4_9ACTN|nr:winged helix-turn-helix transcriptional regulator [Actinacidiphila acididurans]MBM9505623.1 winged helix-turn-helix transcriptional regulator [Actinacidiphila acididurans]